MLQTVQEVTQVLRLLAPQQSEWEYRNRCSAGDPQARCSYASTDVGSGRPLAAYGR